MHVQEYPSVVSVGEEIFQQIWMEIQIFYKGIQMWALYNLLKTYPDADLNTEKVKVCV